LKSFTHSLSSSEHVHDIFERNKNNYIYPTKITTIELASACEEDGACRHVEAHCKRFSCKQRLQVHYSMKLLCSEQSRILTKEHAIQNYRQLSPACTLLPSASSHHTPHATTDDRAYPVAAAQLYSSLPQHTTPSL